MEQLSVVFPRQRAHRSFGRKAALTPTYRMMQVPVEQAFVAAAARTASDPASDLLPEPNPTRAGIRPYRRRFQPRPGPAGSRRSRSGAGFRRRLPAREFER
jgi:hypothetical protein